MSKFPKLNILISYAYFTKDMMQWFLDNKDKCEKINLLIDSGAFTAWKLGNPIELKSYLKFISSLPIKPWNYFALDVVGDPVKTRTNYEEMLRLNYKAIPIFQRGESFDVLDYYYSTTDYISAGGLVGTKGNNGFVKALLNKVAGRKIHLLGYTSPTLVNHFKPYSIDSSSWSSGVRFANIKLYDYAGKWITINKAKFKSCPTPETIRVLSTYDLNYMDLKKSANWKNSGKGDYVFEILNIRSYLKYSMEIERHIGTKYFLALASKWQVELLYQSYEWYLNKYGETYK